MTKTSPKTLKPRPPYTNSRPRTATIQGVAFKNLRPTLPKNTPAELKDVLQSCWQDIPANRPNFAGVLRAVETATKRYKAKAGKGRK